MRPVSFPEVNVVIAKDQPQYFPLPAHRYKQELVEGEGELVCCWKLSIRERLKLLWTGLIWQKILTFNQPLQPQLLSVGRPFFPTETRTPLDIGIEDTKLA